MSQKNHDTCRMHDKSRGTLRETSKDRFAEEKKEMADELYQNKKNLTRLLNEHFMYHSTQQRRDAYVVKFQNPKDHQMEKLIFHYESNLKTLEDKW